MSATFYYLFTDLRVTSMCRMLGVVWRDSDGAKLVAKLTELLYEAASNDYLLRGLTDNCRHCDGYGYLVLYDDGEGFKLVMEKFDAFDALNVNSGNDVCVINLKALKSTVRKLAKIIEGSKRGLLILHARKASKGEPRGVMHAHPYIEGIATRDGYKLIALAHNGSINKKPLARLIGVDPNAYTDTHILTLWLIKQLMLDKDLEHILKEAHKYTRTALNLVIASIEIIKKRLKATLYTYSYISERIKDEKRLKYYKPVFFKTLSAEGFISSTVKLLAVRRNLNLGNISEKTKHLLSASIS